MGLSSDGVEMEPMVDAEVDIEAAEQKEEQQYLYFREYILLGSESSWRSSIRIQTQTLPQVLLNHRFIHLHI